LEKAVLYGADLTKADLTGAQLQAASLYEAQLQGAWLEGVEIKATNFSDAFPWRTKWGKMDPKKLGAVLLDAALKQWKPVWQKVISSSPVPWDAKAYAELRVSMNRVPEGAMRDAALKRIETLDCANPDKTRASCDPAVTPPPEVLDWQKKLAKVSVDDAADAKALAKELRSLVCANDANAIHILRGTMLSRDWAALGIGQLNKTGREAPAFVDFIMSEHCPVSAALTGDDKTTLLELKQFLEQKFAPPPASNKEK
jgi:hypothetical protein